MYVLTSPLTGLNPPSMSTPMQLFSGDPGAMTRDYVNHYIFHHIQMIIPFLWEIHYRLWARWYCEGLTWETFLYFVPISFPSSRGRETQLWHYSVHNRGSDRRDSCSPGSAVNILPHSSNKLVILSLSVHQVQESVSICLSLFGLLEQDKYSKETTSMKMHHVYNISALLKLSLVAAPSYSVSRLCS